MWSRIKALRVLLPNLSWRQAFLAAVGMGLLVGAFCFGRWVVPVQATGPRTNTELSGWHVTEHAVSVNPAQPVAYINNGVRVTRQDLGEYLIARVGPQRLKFLVNRKIIEMACRSRGIVVSEAEVEAELVKHLQTMNIGRLEDFVKTVLNRYNKTLYEYKEDVLRPKIALRKLVEGQVRVTYKDLQDAFEAKYGTKVKCRMLVFPKEMTIRACGLVRAKVMQSEKEFSQYVRDHNPPPLNNTGGAIPPIHKHFPDKNVERVAFSLRKGEVSELIEMPDKTKIVLKCDGHVPKADHVKFIDEEDALKREVHERKLAELQPKFFKQLERQAEPKFVLPREKVDPNAAHRINSQLRLAHLQQRKALPKPPKITPQEPIKQNKLPKPPALPPQSKKTGPVAIPPAGGITPLPGAALPAPPAINNNNKQPSATILPPPKK